MSLADLRLFIFDLTGTSQKDLLHMAEKAATEENLCILAQLAIVYANECGEPVGQELSTASTPVPGPSALVSLCSCCSCFAVVLVVISVFYILL